MREIDLLSTQIRENGVVLVGDLVRDATIENKYYAFVQVTRRADGAQNPTNYKLRTISDIIERLGAELIFVLIEDDRQDVLVNTKAVLIRNFPEKIRNVFPTFGSRGVVVWIEPKGILPAHDLEAMRSTAEDFLGFLKFSLEDVHVTSSENLPTKTACLNAVRFMAPVKLNDLRVELVRRDFHIPSDEWLSHTLDKLRKTDYVVRSKSGAYSLTLLGLRSLGSGKNRRSPDVVRALAMAKRGA